MRFSPEIQTDRLRLRNIGPEHLDFVFRHFSHREVARFLVDAEPVRTVADAQELIEFYEVPERRLRNRWVLHRREDDQPIGTLGLHAYDRHRRKIEIGYDLAPAHWGRGLMAEAAAAAVGHAFESIDVYRIEAYVHVDNARSTKLLDRLGFSREGTLRAMYHFDDRWHDHHIYSLLAPERHQPTP
jgi:ribosomal-protein-alanine N-acetyltransferase